MFNFFKKDQNQSIEEREILASISYIVTKNHKGVVIDVELQDYEDESIDALSSLLDILGEDNSYIDTINIIKASFAEKERFDLLVKIFASIQNKIKLKLSHIHESQSEKPCVKPSEIWSNMNLENR